MYWKLPKYLYSLKHSTGECYSKLSNSLSSNFFQTFSFSFCVYAHKDETVYISVYVDDLAMYEPSSPFVNQIIEILKTKFKITDLSMASSLLEIHITYKSDRMTRSPCTYNDNVLMQFGIELLPSVLTPFNKAVKLVKRIVHQQIDDPIYYQWIVRSLIYAITVTRPDFAHTTILHYLYPSCSNQTHLIAAKHCLRYLNKMKDWTLKFSAAKSLTLKVYTNTDYATYGNNRLLFSGYILQFGQWTVSSYWDGLNIYNWSWLNCTKSRL